MAIAVPQEHVFRKGHLSIHSNNTLEQLYTGHPEAKGKPRRAVHPTSSSDSLTPENSRPADAPLATVFSKMGSGENISDKVCALNTHLPRDAASGMEGGH